MTSTQFLTRINYFVLTIVSAQASTGKQGVLGPTKIYLAVQPSSTNIENAVTDNTNISTISKPTSIQPPPLTLVQPQPSTAQTQIRPSSQSPAQLKPNTKVVVQPTNDTQVFKCATNG